MLKKITFIGSGNVAHNLGNAFLKHGFDIIEVYSRTTNNAKKLAKKLNAKHTTDINKLNKESDLYIIATKDDVINKLALQLSINDKLVVHTSGSVDIDVLKGASNNYGSLYPLQTFTKSHLTDVSEVPFCIEGNTVENKNTLVEIADKLSNKVLEIDSKQRQKLHLAAVFTSNFTNFMQVIAQDICEEQDVDFNLLQPLITEVFNKNINDKAENNQTGPAIRDDKFTMQKHIDLLDKDEKTKELYTLISSMITKRFN